MSRVPSIASVFRLPGFSAFATSSLVLRAVVVVVILLTGAGPPV
jgi:hypothetical protein